MNNFKQNRPLISVVIPTYKRIALLNKCLRALVHQNFPKDQYEVLVVSDGADSETQALVDEFAKEAFNVLYECISERRGPAAARNVGWLKAKGELVTFTDDDCLPDTRWLSTFWAAYQRSQHPLFSGKVIVPLNDPPTDHARNTANLSTAEFITANCACTKAILAKIGGFDERFRLAWREDSDLHFRLLKLAIVPLKVEEAIVVHPVREASWGVSIKEQRKGIYNALLYEKFPSLYKKHIGRGVPVNYYLQLLSVLAGSVFFVVGNKSISYLSFSVWLICYLYFVQLRLRGTTKSKKHMVEMMLTSLIIPALSVYWQFRGMLKYKVIFF